MKCIKFFLVCFFISLSSFSSFASHLMGGDMRVRWLSGNDFILVLTMFRDCNSSAAFDTTVTLGAYAIYNNSALQFITISNPVITNVPLGDSCYLPTICMEKAVYEKVITIPNNASGYYISYNRCCRSSGLANIVDAENSGYVIYCEIPNPALHNSSPEFNQVPDGYMCRNDLNKDDFSCTDIDGDSLAYSFSSPLDCSKPGGMCSSIGGTGFGTVIPLDQPKPYGDVTWQSGYSYNNSVGDALMKINPNTGIVTTVPPYNGNYVFCVRVEEYRNQVKIGEIRRDFQFQMMRCSTALNISSSEPSTICKGKAIVLSAITSDTGFHYSWAPGGETTSAISVSPTTTTNYSVTITKNGCVQKTYATVYVGNALSYTSTVKDYCKGYLGNASVIPTSGNPPYSYLWITVPTQSTSLATGLTQGTYSCQITDSYGCSAVEVIAVKQFPPIVINGSVIDASSCTSNDGAINITVSGGTLPYTYNWSNNETTASINGLTHGSYTLSILDANDCSDVLQAEVKCVTNTFEYDYNGKFIISPNPTLGNFFIKFDQLNINMNDFELIIYNVLGERILYKKGISNLYEIDILSQPDGVYFVQIQKDADILTQKVILKR